MNILFCGDSNVCQGIFLSALSLRNNTLNPFNIYILTARIGDHRAIPPQFAVQLEHAMQASGGEHRVVLLDITETFETYLPTANLSTRFTPLCMLRLFADLVPELPDKLLYLDSDVLFRKNADSLWAYPMENAEIAGVPDRYGKWFFGNIFWHDYLNSGVLLLNMAAIRKSGLFAKCRLMCRDKKMFMPDQSALNKLARKQKLPRKYNEQGNIRPDTVCKHFTTFFRFFPAFHAVTIKPWNTEQMHNQLKIHEFDQIIAEYQRRIQK